MWTEFDFIIALQWVNDGILFGTRTLVVPAALSLGVHTLYFKKASEDYWEHLGAINIAPV